MRGVHQPIIPLVLSVFEVLVVLHTVPQCLTGPIPARYSRMQVCLALPSFIYVQSDTYRFLRLAFFSFQRVYCVSPMYAADRDTTKGGTGSIGINQLGNNRLAPI